MTIGKRRQGHTGGMPGAGRHWRPLTTEDAVSDLRRTESRDGIQRKAPPAGLNDTERLVLRVLDDRRVTAKEIAGFAHISVEQCRRALATLRTLGMAELERPRRKNATNVWRRA